MADKEEHSSGWGVASLILGIIALILCWIPFLGLILAIVAIVISGISLKKETNKGLVITGLVLGILALIPGIIISLVGTALFSAVSNVDQSGLNQSVEKVTGGVNQEKSSREKQNIYSLGEEFTVGNFRYVINDVYTKSSVGNQFSSETADGVFFIVDLTVKNIGNKQEFINDNIFIVDEQGREYGTDTDASIYLEDTLYSIDQINPGISKNGKLIYDVPKEMKGKIAIKEDYLSSDYSAYVSWNE